MNAALKRLAGWLATCFGLGRFPLAPGTFTSAVATVCAVPLVLQGWKALLPGICAVIAVGIPACEIYARNTRIHDPGDCVLDEVAGQWIALIPMAIAFRGEHWLAFVAAFLAFRIFDIWKPWPVWRAERLPGGVGIMADDVLAGAYAGIVVLGALAAGLV